MLRTHLVLPLVTSLSLLAFAPPAEAGPPWTRGHGHEHRAGDCKYEFKSGPHGYKEEYECKGGRKLAGGPPPWAPAHGWRRKHEGYADHHPPERHAWAVPDLGIELGRCHRELLGGVLGGAAGGAIGSQIGKGSGKTVATIGGTIIGVLIGGSIGRSMDEADHVCVAQTLELAPAHQAVTWSSPAGAQYRLVPLRDFADDAGRVCREYRTVASIEGRQQHLRGTACRAPDGTWTRQSRT